MNVQQYYEYCFIGFACCALLISFFSNVKQYGHKTLSGKFLEYFILTLIVCSFLEIIYGLIEGELIDLGITFTYVIEIIYYIVVIAASYFWFISSSLYQKAKIIHTKARRIIVSIPLLIIIILTITTPFNHLVFYLEDSHYSRGPLYLPIVVITSIFIIWTGISALTKSFKKEFYLDRSYFRVIFLYAFILLLFQFAQIVLGPIMPFRTLGATLVVYIIQQKYIKENIYVDNLTGANNRNLADKYLNNHINNENMRIAMIDLDNFKNINDTYGHQAGDKALKLVAKAFMENLPNSSFFARYGGDEFLLIDLAKDEIDIENIIHNTKTTLKELCFKESINYEISFSYGIVQKNSKMQTIPDIMKEADIKMYSIKKEKKIAR